MSGDYPVLMALARPTAVLITDPADVVAKEGESAVFSVEVSDPGSMPLYQWNYRKNNTDPWTSITGSTTKDHHVIASAIAAGKTTGFYMCTITFGDGTVLESQHAELTVDDDLKTVHTEVCLTENGPGTGGYVYPGGILYTTSDSINLTMTAMDGYTLTKATIGGIYGEDITGDLIYNSGVWTYSFDLTEAGEKYIWAFFTPTITATVTVCLDDVVDDEYAGTIVLKNGDVEHTLTGPFTNGVCTFTDIASGTYKIFAGGIDTGLTITPTSLTAKVDYYTVNFSRTVQGMATNDSYMAATNGIDSGDAVLSGTEFEIVAAGMGAPGSGASYTYLWTDSEVNDQLKTNASYPVKITKERTVSCEITGYPGTVDAYVLVWWNDDPYTGNDVKIELKQAGVTKYDTSTHTTGKFSFSGITYGDYDVFANGVDTKEDIKGEFLSANVKYYTVEYEVRDDPYGASKDSTIDSAEVKSKDAVLKGTSIIITVTGKGAMGTGASYEYKWTDKLDSDNIVGDEKSYAITVDSKVSVSCLVTGEHGTTSVRVNVMLDDAEYKTCSDIITLRYGGGSPRSCDIKSDHAFIFIGVPYGEHKIYADGIDTGQIAAGIDPIVNVNFYSVTYSVEDSAAGTSTGSTIDSAQVSSGGIVLKGTSVTIVATAAGSSGTAPIYKYEWSNYASKTNTLTIPSVTTKVETVCTITGTDNNASTPKYIITATSDPGSFISPSGNVTVERGNNRTFTFGAVEGYSVSDVLIDGVSHPELISAGTYTFSNVVMNHSIAVKNTRTLMTLNIEILEGKGHVEYSVNGGAFNTYSEPVILSENSNVILKAYADKGYAFKEWSGDRISNEPEISFSNVVSSIYMEVTFEEDNNGALLPSWSWYLIGAFLFLLAALLLLLLVFYRRTYEVVKVTASEEAIFNGDDRARRKRAYSFTLEGSTGPVSYMVGEEGQWKPLIPDRNGTYTIPKEDVIDKLTIEQR